MFKFISLALIALTALSAVNGLPIAARATPPPGWIAEILEVIPLANPLFFTCPQTPPSRMMPTTPVTLLWVAGRSTIPSFSMTVAIP